MIAMALQLNFNLEYAAVNQTFSHWMCLMLINCPEWPAVRWKLKQHGESDDKSFDPSNEKLVSLSKLALWLTILISHLPINVSNF